MASHFYVTKGLSNDLNGKIVALNTVHEDHPNLAGPIRNVSEDQLWKLWQDQRGLIKK